VPLGLDYSAARIAATAIVEAGFTDVFRYVEDPNRPQGTKHTDPRDYAALVEAGLAVHLLFEVNTRDWAQGFVGGAAYATRALAGAEWVGHHGLIFATVDDSTVTPASMPTVLAYLQAFEAVLGHGATGVYGFSNVITAAQGAGIGSAYMQCGHPPAPDSGVHVWQVPPPTGVRTVADVTVDINRILIPLPPGGDMTPQESQMLADVHQQLLTAYPAWAGGETDAQGTPYDVVQYEQRANVYLAQLTKIVLDAVTRLTQLSEAVTALSSAFEALVPPVATPAVAPTSSPGA
jgi:Domain of unknown function (DUF1906)